MPIDFSFFVSGSKISFKCYSKLSKNDLFCPKKQFTCPPESLDRIQMYDQVLLIFAKE